MPTQNRQFQAQCTRLRSETPPIAQESKERKIRVSRKAKARTTKTTTALPQPKIAVISQKAGAASGTIATSGIPSHRPRLHLQRSIRLRQHQQQYATVPTARKMDIPKRAVLLFIRSCLKSFGKIALRVSMPTSAPIHAVHLYLISPSVKMDLPTHFECSTGLTQPFLLVSSQPLPFLPTFPFPSLRFLIPAAALSSPMEASQFAGTAQLRALSSPVRLV